MTEMAPRGWLNIYKPSGMTSFDAVRTVQKILGTRRVGHAGTLDPGAVGVLPMAVGSATRLLEWCDDVPKAYQAWMVFGTLTTTGDGQGMINARSGPPYPDRSDVLRASRYLVGPGLQIPPQVSALKQKGQALYRLVGRGQSVWPAPRRIHVYRLEVLDGQDQRWRVAAEVGKGTYIRSLIRDWGDLLGQAAHLEELARIQVGAYRIEQAISLEEFARSGPAALKPPVWGLSIPGVAVGPERWQAIAHGRPPDHWSELESYQGEVALTAGHEVLAVVTGPPWRYRKVLNNVIGDDTCKQP